MGCCAVALPWWPAARASSIVTAEPATRASISLWTYEVEVSVPISPDSPDMQLQTLESTWDELCEEEERKHRKVPSKCVQIKCARAFSLLVPILCLFAILALLAGLQEPLALLAGAALTVLAALCSAAGVVSAMMIGTAGLVGPGVILLFASGLGVSVAFAAIVYAASKAMPADDTDAGAGKKVDGPRMLRAEIARMAAQKQALFLEANVQSRPKTPASDVDPEQGVGGAGTHRSQKSSAGGSEGQEEGNKFKNLETVLFWSQTHGNDETEQIPVPLLQKAFREMDEDRSGRIDLDELVGALQACGLKASHAATEIVMKEIDTNSSGDIDIHEFVGFFRSIEELARFQQRTEQRAQFVTYVCSCCFITHIILVGVLLMTFINMDSDEDPDNYAIMKNLLIGCSCVLGLLFMAVVAIPATKLTLGNNIAAWQRHYDKRFEGVKKKKISGSVHDCKFGCGFQGSLDAVRGHQLECPLQGKGGAPAPRAPTQVAWGGEVEAPEATRVNAAVQGASYRVRKVQAQLAASQVYACDYGCGFTGSFDETRAHEPTCMMGPAGKSGATSVQRGPGGTRDNFLTSDTGESRYDPLAFKQAQFEQMMSEGPPRSFNAMAGRDTGQSANPEMPETGVPGMLAIDDGGMGSTYGNVRPNPNWSQAM
mmetsp:Transcript_50133/g.151889  ORF Transcript_50133/g.151889 Transcript_50133/m.151889 type:complete len:655 (-) Transcript_50133:137-2101(-)